MAAGGGQSAAIRAGAAFVELFTKDIGLVKGLDAAKKRVEAFGKTVAAISIQAATVGAAIALPLVSAFKKMTGTGAELLDLARSSNTSVEALSTLAFAAKSTGASFEDLVAAQAHINSKLSDLRDGSREVAIEFAQIGINAQDLLNLPLDKQLAMIADALAKVKNKEDLAKAGAIGLGGSFGKLQDLLAGGSEGLQSRINQAIASGATVTKEQAQQSKQAELIFSQAWTAMQQVAISLAAALLPSGESMEEVSQKIQLAAKAATDWIAKNKPLIVLSAKIAVGILAAAIALKALAVAAGIASAALTILSVGVSLASAAVGFLLTPVGAVSALLAVGALAFVSYSEAGQEASSKVGATFQKTVSAMGSTFKSAWSGILASLKSGDLEGAARIVGAGLRAAWSAALAGMTDLWNDFKGVIVDRWHDMGYALSAIWNDLWAGIRKGLVIALGHIVETFLSAVNSLGDAANAINKAAGGDPNYWKPFTSDFGNKGASDTVNQIERDRQAKEKAIWAEANARKRANKEARDADSKAAWDDFNRDKGLLDKASEAAQRKAREMDAAAGLKEPQADQIKPGKIVIDSPGEKKVPNIFQLGAAAKGVFQGPYQAQLGYGSEIGKRDLTDNTKATKENTEAIKKLAASGAFKFR